MQDPTNRDVELLYEIGTTRFIQRTWRQFLGPDFANLAEHTLRVTWTSLLIAQYEHADSGKILKMAMIHDLPESRTGDAHYVSSMYTVRDEDRALRDILSGTIVEEELRLLWLEFEERKTLEAQIVKDADNLDVDFEIQEQSLKNFKIKTDWYRNRSNSIYPKFFTDTAKRLWRMIYDSSPSDWHVHGVNRFMK